MDDISKATSILPENFNDPFYKKFVQSLTVTASIDPFKGHWVFYGHINFTNDMTHGTQGFEGGSFDDVVLKVKAFIDSMR